MDLKIEIEDDVNFKISTGQEKIIIEKEATTAGVQTYNAVGTAESVVGITTEV